MFWGLYYLWLLVVKCCYDLEGLFVIYYGVGSEDWSLDGFIL